MKHATAMLTAVALLAIASPELSQAEVSFDFFVSYLSPHGDWAVSAQYGQVWQPRSYAAGWNPYYDGHWEYTDVGCTWVSDYPWGAVPYHYGTWVMDPALGWIWVPGYVWAPSWVVFRTGPSYIGWAPVSPQFSVGISFGAAYPAAESFVFIPANRFLVRRVRGYVVPPSARTTIIQETTVINTINIRNDIVVNSGPDVAFVERATKRSVRERPIERVERAAPFKRVSREQLRVDSHKGPKALRAATPQRESSRASRERSRGSAMTESRRPSRDATSGPRRPAEEQTRGRSTAENRGQPPQASRSSGQSIREPSRARPTNENRAPSRDSAGGTSRHASRRPAMEREQAAAAAKSAARKQPEKAEPQKRTTADQSRRRGESQAQQKEKDKSNKNQKGKKTPGS